MCIFIYLPISYPRYAASLFAANCGLNVLSHIIKHALSNNLPSIPAQRNGLWCYSLLATIIQQSRYWQGMQPPRWLDVGLFLWNFDSLEVR
jgi:hypothetical protein